MAKAVCRHQWITTHIRSELLVVRSCFHCRKFISSFSEGPVPPIDDYMEGAHFWSRRGDSEASKFDLLCGTCSKEVRRPELMAIRPCMTYSPAWGVFEVSEDSKDKKRWVSGALFANTPHTSGTCISREGIRALNEYFNQGLQDASRRGHIVRRDLRPSVDTCQGVVLADVGLTEIY
jgi:hypothetical protein